jgi:hypothetical protein
MQSLVTERPQKRITLPPVDGKKYGSTSTVYMKTSKYLRDVLQLFGQSGLPWLGEDAS